MNSLHKIATELRRREVFRTVGLYIVGSWVVLQVAALAFQSLEIPDGALVWVWAAIFLGFPVALVFSWRYDLTAKGIVRTPPPDADGATDLSLRGIDFAILTALATVAILGGAKSIVEIGNIESGSRSQIHQGIIVPNSVAVLPLENLSGDPEQAYFVSGMHEALIASLARISQLKVISRTSTEQYRDTSKTVPEIAAELGVTKLIEGSVLRNENQVRITVQLIDATMDESIWTETYVRHLSDILQLQSNVARAIASQVKVKLTSHEDAAFAKQAEVNPEAYEYYLKGRFHWYRFAEGDLALALEYFQRAIDTDPDYALAYVGFADALATPAHVGLIPTTGVFPAANRFVRRALELDPDLAEAHDLLARISFAYDWDWDAAERGFRRAVSLKPGYPDVHVVYSQYLALMNRWEESLQEARTGLDLDPLNPWFRMELAQRLTWVGQFDEARTHLNEVIAHSPDFFPAFDVLSVIAQEQGQKQEAMDMAARYFELLGEAEIASVLKSDPGAAEYDSTLRRAAVILETRSARPYVSNVNLARLRMLAGDIDRALEHLEEAYLQRESALVYTIADPLFRPAWNDARYLDLRRRLNR